MIMYEGNSDTGICTQTHKYSHMHALANMHMLRKPIFDNSSLSFKFRRSRDGEYLVVWSIGSGLEAETEAGPLPACSLAPTLKYS